MLKALTELQIMKREMLKNMKKGRESPNFLRHFSTSQIIAGSQKINEHQ